MGLNFQIILFSHNFDVAYPIIQIVLAQVE